MGRRCYGLGDMLINKDGRFDVVEWQEIPFPITNGEAPVAVILDM